MSVRFVSVLATIGALAAAAPANATITFFAGLNPGGLDNILFHGPRAGNEISGSVRTSVDGVLTVIPVFFDTLTGQTLSQVSMGQARHNLLCWLH
jgi:hypothetical protein